MSHHIGIIEAQALASERQHAAQVRMKASITARLMDAAMMLQQAPDDDARAALWIAGEALVDAIQDIWRVAR